MRNGPLPGLLMPVCSMRDVTESKAGWRSCQLD